ncbi:MAG: carboxypeptidase-like regulatory domain-containing protein [Bacteroidetes bacterium]|nr:carboxypeptidase-like regulatory domain-containing protein [Bacteroidota bacterium]MBS1973219.1 carboxypeptidase-like regulatory domain-containing protein [Bacteroidota bacterium]
MIRKYLLILLITLRSTGAVSQNEFIIKGKVIENATNRPIPYATVHLIGSPYSTLSKTDGSFRLHITGWYDSLEVTSVGFERYLVALQNGSIPGIVIQMKHEANTMQEVVIGAAKKPGKRFMEKVIANKANNNPSRFRSYSYKRYTRNELDIDQVDYAKAKGAGLKNLMLKTYSGLDSNAKSDKELPIYFAEYLANVYHSMSPNIEKENIIAKKNLGLKTDGLLSRLDKFYFFFNVYDDWLPLFSQTYVSPLNANAFSYYKYFEGTTMLSENGDTIQQIRFAPLREYEKAFSGTLWINRKTLAVETVSMHLAKTANLNFISDIKYSQDYKQVFDSASDQQVYMPYKFSSEVIFESGLELLGIPVPENKNSLKFIIKNTTVTDKIQLNTEDPSVVLSSLIKKEQTTNWDKPESFWVQNRPDFLTLHEKNIYRMVDSLKANDRFQRDVKLIAFAGTGYWDFNKYIRIGPYSAFVSHNPIEEWRFRTGFWTMPGISKKVNLFGYGAYGTKDRKLKGMLGIKYIWNEARWTKTSISYGSDYDFFIIDQYDELDKDNIVHSLFRKNVPFSRIYIKQILFKHEQYLSPNFSAMGSISYKELNPVFDFKYLPINPNIENTYDSVFFKKLPIAEASIGIRYAHNERTTILNYDNIRLGTFSPIFFVGYTYGFELANAQFEYHKVNLGMEQRLRLPPKIMFYYKIEGGKIFGTLPYLLLNIPPGNEYYVAGKYQFNTMSPYEFAADRYVNLRTRLYFGGALFDKIPLLRKLGWRERLSFNSYWGDMTDSNIAYNKSSNFNLVGKTPFMEAGVGIENIFHIMSIEYYRRLNYLNNPYARKDGVYVGLTLMF